MGNLNRKDFLRLTTWSFIATLLPVSSIVAIADSFDVDNPMPTNDDYNRAVELAKTAKDSFYRKDFAKAEEVYLLCIKLAPRAIRFYDNLDNVYGAQGKVLNSVELYRKGLLANPSVIAFYDRAARSLMRLETGRKLLAKSYQNKINSQSLLKDAELLYLKALEIDKEKSYLRIGLAKVVTVMTQDAGVYQDKNRLERKSKQKQNRILFRKALEDKTNEEIEALIEKVRSKKRTKLYVGKEKEQQNLHVQQQEKKYFRLLLERKLASGQSINYAERLFEIDHSDTRSLTLLKKEYYKNGKFVELIAARQKFAEKKQTMYSFLGTMDAIEQAYKKGQVGVDQLDRSILIGKDLMQNWMLIPRTEVDVVDKLAKAMVMRSNFIEAEATVKATMERISTTSPAVINKIIYRYAKIFFDGKNFKETKRILLTALQEKEIDADGILFLETLIKKKVNEGFHDKRVLLYLLHDTYKALGETPQANAVLGRLGNEDPQDKFVLKRK